MNPDRFEALSRTLGRSTSRRQTFKLVTAGLVGGFVVTSGLNKTAAQTNPFTLPVSGTIAGEAFEGVLEVTRFFTRNGRLLADVVIVDEAGDIIAEFVAGVTPQQNATCEILRLELAPLRLDLLGLIIELPNELVLVIEAESGPGNLLGNLLCAIAGLLDRPNATVGALARLLNRLLGLFG